MRRLCLIVLLSAFVLFSAGASLAGWVRQFEPLGENLYSVHFPENSQTGYMVGDGGLIEKTTNGGRDWTPQVLYTVPGLRSVHFPVDASTGYAVGEVATILKTTNGGTDWMFQ